MKKQVVEYNYDELHIKEKIMAYCKLNDVCLKSIHHSKIKNHVTNLLYCSKELSETEKLMFLFIYDIKSQQKYLPGIHINQKRIAIILNVSESTISRAFQSLIKYNLLIESENRFKEKIFMPNENISKWGVSIDTCKLSMLEELRKHVASSNVQLTEEYKEYNKVQA